MGRRGAPPWSPPCVSDVVCCIWIYCFLVACTRHLFLFLSLFPSLISSFHCVAFSLSLSLSLSLFMSPRAYFSPLWSSAAYASNDRPFQMLSPPMKSDYFGLAARHSAENEKIISLTNSESLYSSLNTWLRSPALLLAKIPRSRLWLVEKGTMNQRKGRMGRKG